MKTKRFNIFSSRFLFNSLVISFVLVLLDMFLLNTDRISGSIVFIPWVLLCITGIGLTISVYREKISGKSKFFLLSAGFSSAGFLLFVVLHNLLYALGTITQHIVILNQVINFLEAAFFIAGIIICPVFSIVGIVGTIIIRLKSRSSKIK